MVKRRKELLFFLFYLSSTMTVKYQGEYGQNCKRERERQRHRETERQREERERETETET